MGIILDAMAALSYNTKVDTNLTEDQKAYYRHVQLLDRTEEELKYLDFIEKKIGFKDTRIEKDSKVILEYKDKYGKVDLEKIFDETGIATHYLQRAIPILNEYYGCDIMNDTEDFLKNSTQKKALQDIEHLFSLLMKKINGEFGEQEKNYLIDNEEKLKKDIEILRDIIKTDGSI